MDSYYYHGKLNMLGKHQTFLHAAFIGAFLHVRSDVDKGPAVGYVEPGFFAVGFHGNLRLWIGRAAIRTCCIPAWPGPGGYRFLPYVSWLETHSPAMTALAREISPHRTVAATISASFLTLPVP